MTHDERARATWAYCEAHRHEWEAWQARPWQERAGIQDKVMATIDAHGVLVGREMARALGVRRSPTSYAIWWTCWKPGWRRTASRWTNSG